MTILTPEHEGGACKLSSTRPTLSSVTKPSLHLERFVEDLWARGCIAPLCVASNNPSLHRAWEMRNPAPKAP